MFLWKKISNFNDLKSITIILSSIIVFYFWDFGAKYNLKIETRYLTLIPLLFFLNKKILNKKILNKNGFSTFLIIILFLIFQYIFNYLAFGKFFSFTDLKYFLAFTLTIAMVFLCKEIILLHKVKITKFLIFLTPFFLINSDFSIWSEIDRLWQCSIFNTNSSLFYLFFLENSHFAMVAIPVFLLNLFLLCKRFSLLNFFLVVTFFMIMIFFASTTMMVANILSIFIILITNFKKINIKFLSSCLLVLFIYSLIFLNVYGCSRKFTDLIFHYYVISSKHITEYDLKKRSMSEEEKSSETLLMKTKMTLMKQHVNLYNNYRYFSNTESKRREFLASSQISSENFSNLNDADRQEVLHKINVSSQVFKNSFEISIETLFTKPLGVGLNRFEDAFKDNIKFQQEDYSHEIMKINLKDGGSNLNKLIAEFGIASFIIFIYIMIFICSQKISIENKLFLFPIVFTQFIRGAGYFNGGFLFSIILIILIVHDSKKEN